MATYKRLIVLDSILKIPKLLTKYRNAVNTEAYKGLDDVAKFSVTAVKVAVLNAPPTKTGSSLPLVANGAVATGKYRDSWKAKRMKLSGIMGVLIYSTQPHAPIVEYGRRSGRMPPVRAIQKWLQAKFFMPYSKAKALAFPIARSIKNHSIMGRKVLSSPDTSDWILYFLDETLEKAIARAISVTFP